MKQWMILALAVACVAQPGAGKTVGVHKDARALVTDGLMKTLQEAGWQTVMLDDKALATEAALTNVDVALFTGGWGAYFFPSFEGRRTLTTFVAGGKGILSSGFRSGYSRTANRPLFPQVGAVHNRGNGSFIVGSGDSALAKAIAQPFSPGGWDHMIVKAGPEGKVFAVCAGDPVAVYGEPYGGRYVAIGAFLGGSAASNGVTGVERQLLVTMLDWLASAPKRSEADIAKARTRAELDFLRRERVWDWTLNERGPDRGPGVIPGVRNRLAVPLESRLYRLQYMLPFVARDAAKAAQAEMDLLRKEVEQLDAAARKATADAMARLNRLTAAELLAEKPAEAGAALQEQLLPVVRLAEIKSRADGVIAALRPQVQAAKAERLARERQADTGGIQDLVKGATASDVNARREAVMELGRIGDPKGAEALIGAIADKDEQVRIRAILGLGWMQSKESVPALIKLAEGSDLRMKRRAVQALGQIGDSRAISPLLARIADPDTFTAENAILALGWLKTREAVPGLLKIATTFDRKNGLQRGLMLAAIRALGHIGDASALPALENLRDTASDFPAPNKKPNARIVNIYSTAQTLGLQGHAELAIEAIKAGGASRPGIEQPAFLASRDRFYALTRRFNALAGRSFITLGANFPEDWTALLPYLKDAGMTGLHNAWGEQEADPTRFFELVRAAGDLDLVWVDVWPMDSNGFGGKTTVADSRQMALEKAAGDTVAQRYRNEPAFAGFWSEETYPWVRCEAGEFEAWFKAKYGTDPRQQYGLPADYAIPPKDTPLKTEYLEFCGEKMLAHWQESQEWMDGLRKGCALTFSLSHRHLATYIGVTGPSGDAIKVPGPEIYQSFGRDNAFMMEMFKDGRARPVMAEFYNWYTPSPAHEVRGFAQHLMHGECFYNFDLHQIFGQASAYYMWSWEATRWDNARKIFGKAARISEYLEVPASAANMAQLCSEMTACHYNTHNSPLGARWYQHQASLWTALQQSQIPADVIWAETLTPEKLARYRVLVMADAKMLTEGQMGLIRDWVKQGGVLIAAGSSSLVDLLQAPRKNYALADVFGVDYGGFAGVADPAKNDTLAFEVGKAPLPVESSMMLPAARNHVHRELKPAKSIGTYSIGKTEALPGMTVGAACEYDMPLGYDKVKPTSAETLAAFANSDPAMTLNKVGQGLCYLWTPIYPGLCYVGSEFENDANRKDFWPNVREVLAAMVKGGLAYQQATLPVDVTGVSKEVEVTVRQQPERNRMMVHLLDYDTKSTGVKGASVVINPPAGKTVQRLFYPDTGTEVTFSARGIGVTAALREFEVHDMIVVEWL